MSNAFSLSTKNMSEMVAISKVNYDILVQLVNEVLGNGGPSGVFDTLQELNDRYPKGAKGVYLVTVNGKWYYWDGSEWAAGGVYQATQLADGSVTDVKLNIDLQHKINSIEGIGQEAEKANVDLANHKSSSQAHNAAAITYGGYVPGASNAKQAIDILQTNINNQSQRISNILAHNGDGTKDSELIDIHIPDPSYTPQRQILVAGDMTRDMQKQFGEQLADIALNVAKEGIETDVDQTQQVSTLVEVTNKNLLFPALNTPFILNEVPINKTIKLLGNDTTINVTEANKRAFVFMSPSELIRNPMVWGMQISQVNSSDPGSGIANDHAPVSFRGAINAKALLNNFQNSSLGITNQFGDISLSDRLSKHNLVAFNYFERLEKMAIENIGSAYTRIVGNGIDGHGANSHGIRITGYGVDGINTKATGHVAAANVLNGMQNAISLQNTARYNTFAAQSSNNTAEAVIDVRPPTNYENAPSFNVVRGQTFVNTKRVIYNDEGQYNSFDVVGYEATDTAILDDASPVHGVDGHNEYRALIKKIAGDGALIRRPYARLDLDLIEVTGTGVTLSVDASYATGKIRVHKANVGVNILASNCQLDLHVTECSEVAGNSIIIQGNNNVVNLFTDKNVRISGTNNVVRGYVGGSITNVIPTNNITGVVGYSARGQEINVTTDASGLVTVTHGLKTSRMAANVNVFGATAVTARVANVNASNLVLGFRNVDGSVYANQQLSFFWIAEGY